MLEPKPPDFPEGFYAHCPKVLEAKEWGDVFCADEDTDYTAFAQCAFHKAGNGLECENCRLFLTRPYLSHDVDREWLPQIEEYYARSDEYERELARLKAIDLENGSGI